MAAWKQHNEEKKPVRNVLRVLKIKPHACRVGWGQAKRWGFFGVCFSQLQNVKTHAINGRWIFQIKTTPYPPPEFGEYSCKLIHAGTFESINYFWLNEEALTATWQKWRQTQVFPGNTRDHQRSQEHCSSFHQTQNISCAPRRQAQGPAAVTSLLQVTKLAKTCYKAR